MDDHDRRVAATVREAEEIADLITQALNRHGVQGRIETQHDPTGDAVGLALVLEFHDMRWLADLVANHR